YDERNGHRGKDRSHRKSLLEPRFAGSGYGVWSRLEFASSVCPGRPPVDTNVTVRPLTRFEPLRAIDASTEICSPAFRVSRRQPLRCRPCGGPSSMPQFTTSPVASSFTLM